MCAEIQVKKPKIIKYQPQNHESFHDKRETVSSNHFQDPLGSINLIRFFYYIRAQVRIILDIKIINVWLPIYEENIQVLSDLTRQK